MTMDDMLRRDGTGKLSEGRSYPPFDDELGEILATLQCQQAVLPTPFLADMIAPTRAAMPATTVADIIGDRPVTHTEHSIRAFGGAQITLSVFSRTDQTAAAPAVYHIHGGGMVLGDRFTGAAALVEWAERYGAACISIDYRLAPEHPDPIPVEDCYAGFVWVCEHAAELQIDPSRVLIAGGSAGGGLAAGVALLARDRVGPQPLAQLLVCPMLDDRNDTVSARQIDGVGLWDRVSNETGWTALLGERRGGGDVSIYAAPARATDLSGLPPAYIDVAASEVFRDEAVAYASRIWAAGGPAHLHVWGGGFHGFSEIAPFARMSIEALRVRESWIANVLGRP